MIRAGNRRAIIVTVILAAALGASVLLGGTTALGALDVEADPGPSASTHIQASAPQNPASERKTGWPLIWGNAGNTGHINTTGPTGNIAVRWNSSIRSGFPRVVDTGHFENRTVYVGHRALDAKTGEQRWNTSHLLFNPAVVNGTIYQFEYRSSSSTLFALDAETGEDRWHVNFTRRANSKSSPIVVDGTVYVGLGDRVFALDAATGEERWNVSTGPLGETTPAVVDGTVYVGTRDGKVYALDAATGQKRWTVTTGASEHSSPAVVGGTVYVGSGSTVYALDAATGEKRWSVATDGEVSQPAVADGNVYLFDDSTDPAHDTEAVYESSVLALDAETGSKLWESTTNLPFGRFIGSPAVVDGTVYVGHSNGAAYAFDAQTGEKRWRFELDDRVVSSPVVVGGTVYVVSKRDTDSGPDERILYALTEGTPRTTPTATPTPAPPTPTPATPESTDWWPMAGANPARTGHVDTTGPTGDVVERWDFSTGGEIRSSPAVVDGTVYAVSLDNNLYALDTETGSLQWTFETQGLMSSPAVVDGTVYGSSGETLYAIDAETGTERWTFERDSRISSPTVADDTVFVGSKKLYALDAATGEERWHTTIIGRRGPGPVAVSNGTIYLEESGKVVALNADTGTARWASKLGRGGGGPLAVAGGTVYVGGGNVQVGGTTVYALDARTGTERWNHTTEFTMKTPPAVSGDTLYVGGKESPEDPQGRVVALYTENGTERWTHEFVTQPSVSSGTVRGHPAVANKTVYVARETTVHALHADTGTVRWSFETRNIVASPAVVDGTLYFGNRDSNVYALADNSSTPISPTANTPTPAANTLTPTETGPETIPGFGVGAAVVAIAAIIGLLAWHRRD